MKFFNNVKGYGFISPSDDSKDVFFHANDVTDQQVLMEGDEVGASFWGVAERFDWFPIVFQMESFRVLEHFRSEFFKGCPEGDGVGGASMAF